MLKYSSADISFQSEDKGPDLSASSAEDPFNDLFNQLISHDSSASSDNANLSHSFDYLHFPIHDDTTSISSNLGEHTSNNVRSHTVRPQRLRPAGLRCTQSQEVLPSQTYQRFACFERPKAAISGAELLNLEGKIVLQASPTRSNLVSVSTTPPNRTLRRKTTISPETLRHRYHHKVSKSPGVGITDSSKMMRPSYYYRQEPPSIHEWTQRFEQISLQAPVRASPMSPPPSDVLFRDEKGPRNPALNPGAAYRSLEQKESYENISTQLMKDSLQNMTDFNPLPSPTDFSNFDTSSSQPAAMVIDEGRETRSSVKLEVAISPPLPPEHPSSWIQPAASTDSFDFTISPSEIHSNWPPSLLDTSGGCYDNVVASHSAPALTHTGMGFPNLSDQGLMIQDHPMEQFITENPSLDYFSPPPDPFASAAFDTYPPIPPPAINTGRPRTPSSLPPSPCPSPSPTSKSPSKSRRRSKSSRRRASTKSLQQPTAIEFVNFTPNDSQKILNGVAPSGSSKTKARREQEDNDKRRKLSQAAEEAVRDSGGDVSRFRASKFLK